MYGNRHSWVAAEAPKMWQQQASQADPQIDSECERGNDSRTIANCPSEFWGQAFAGGWPRGKEAEMEWSRVRQMVAVVKLDISVCYGSACICISLGLCVCLCASVLASSCRFVSSNYRWSRVFFRHLPSCFCCFRSCCCCCCGCWHVFPRSTHRIQFAWFYFRFSSLAVLPSFLLSLPGGTCSLPVRYFLFSLSLAGFLLLLDMILILISRDTSACNCNLSVQFDLIFGSHGSVLPSPCGKSSWWAVAVSFAIKIDVAKFTHSSNCSHYSDTKLPFCLIFDSVFWELFSFFSFAPFLSVHFAAWKGN